MGKYNNRAVFEQADARFSHVAAKVPGEDAPAERCEPVSGEEYGKPEG